MAGRFPAFLSSFCALLSTSSIIQSSSRPKHPQALHLTLQFHPEPCLARDRISSLKTWVRSGSGPSGPCPAPCPYRALWDPRDLIHRARSETVFWPAAVEAPVWRLILVFQLPWHYLSLASHTS
ncbi:hypothetical protein N657DRAFT_375563 [Parathielavia appendiculata]|uniref:Secreted protein n=1 Tax=Parathielavia appendiculata TaxID=2587402 RepID=A0AAN6TPQ3_9PEZI|nr:hypothetical protein N657DRAFT_375563 [Parathielavia appendiculata]